MIITSYVTDEYKKYGKRLKNRLDELGVFNHVEFMDSFGSTKDHKIYKPFFLNDMMRLYPDDDIVIVDGDSYFLDKPPDINIKADMGLVLGKQHENHQYWFSDAFHVHRHTPGTEEFIRIWMDLCKDRDWIKGNNHPRILATFYLTRRMTSWEYINLDGTFVRNYGKKGAMTY